MKTAVDDWIVNILADIQTFAKINRLRVLERELGRVISIALAETKCSEDLERRYAQLRLVKMPRNNDEIRAKAVRRGTN